MGDGDKTPLRLQFNPKVRLEFHGATITSDAGLLPIRELDDALGLTHIAADYLQESRTGRNIRDHLVPLLRQSIYSRLADHREHHTSHPDPSCTSASRTARTEPAPRRPHRLCHLARSAQLVQEAPHPLPFFRRHPHHEGGCLPLLIVQARDRH